MRIARGVMFAIVATLALLSGTASIASANPDSGAPIADATTASADPGDPGFPPDE